MTCGRPRLLSKLGSKSNGWGTGLVKVRYLGIGDAKAAFEGLRPYRERLIELQGACKPFHADFLMLHAAQKALDAAAHYFTNDPNFFALKPEQSRYGEQRRGN